MTKPYELIGAGMLLLMIVGTITAVGAGLDEEDAVASVRAEVAALTTRLDIEHRERDELARRLAEVEEHVEALYDLDDSQATGIQLLEQDLTEYLEGRQAREAWPAESYAMRLEVGE